MFLSSSSFNFGNIKNGFKNIKNIKLKIKINFKNKQKYGIISHPLMIGGENMIPEEEILKIFLLLLLELIQILIEKYM